MVKFYSKQAMYFYFQCNFAKGMAYLCQVNNTHSLSIPRVMSQYYYFTKYNFQFAYEIVGYKYELF